MLKAKERGEVYVDDQPDGENDEMDDDSDDGKKG